MPKVGKASLDEAKSNGYVKADTRTGCQRCRHVEIRVYGKATPTQFHHCGKFTIPVNKFDICDRYYSAAQAARDANASPLGD